MNAGFIGLQVAAQGLELLVLGRILERHAGSGDLRLPVLGCAAGVAGGGLLAQIPFGVDLLAPVALLAACYGVFAGWLQRKQSKEERELPLKFRASGVRISAEALAARVGVRAAAARLGGLQAALLALYVAPAWQPAAAAGGLALGLAGVGALSALQRRGRRRALVLSMSALALVRLLSFFVLPPRFLLVMLLAFLCHQGKLLPTRSLGVREWTELAGERRVAVTILTGFLGAGKTTLLNRILSEDHGLRVAVIENEFGEVGVDSSLLHLVKNTEENLVTFNNGCVCCSIRGDLVKGLQQLRERRAELDVVLIELTGLADPAPAAQTVLVDPSARQWLELDAVVTLVDAQHFERQLARRGGQQDDASGEIAEQQVAFADHIVLNKTDLVDAATAARVERKLRDLNPAASLRAATRADVPLADVVGTGAFSLERVSMPDFAGDGGWEESAAAAAEGSFEWKAQRKRHGAGISSVGFDVPGEVDKVLLNQWLVRLLESRGEDIFRMKGVFAVRGESHRYVFQGVHMTFDAREERPWAPGEERRNTLCFIGKRLDREFMRAGFEECFPSD